MPKAQLLRLRSAITTSGYRGAADQLGLSPSTVYRLARRHLPDVHAARQRPRIEPDRLAQIRHDLLSDTRPTYRTIADAQRVAPCTVHRLASAAGLHRRTLPSTTTRCPGCGAKINTDHCVACAVLSN